MDRQPAARWIEVDAARGLALLGMMAVHIFPSHDADHTVSVAYFVAAGRASALFAVLAGIGLALANGRSHPLGGEPLRIASAGTAARAAAIGAIGLALGELHSGVVVILVNYGFLFLVGTFFLGLDRRTLVVLAGVWIVAAPVVSHWLRRGMPAPELLVPGVNELADPFSFLREILFTGYYPVFVWVAYLLVGLAIGRGPRPGLNLAVVGLAMAVAGKVGSWLALGLASHPPQDIPLEYTGTTPTSSWWYLAVSTPHSGTPFDLLHTTGTALAVIGICALTIRALGWPVAMGAMTLSLYTFHVIALAVGHVPSPHVNVWLAHAGAALAFGMVWKRAVGRGPLESLVARLSDAARQAVTPPNPPTS